MNLEELPDKDKIKMTFNQLMLYYDQMNDAQQTEILILMTEIMLLCLEVTHAEEVRKIRARSEKAGNN